MIFCGISCRPDRDRTEVPTPVGCCCCDPDETDRCWFGRLYTAHDVDDDGARNGVTPQHDAVTLVLTESAALGRRAPRGKSLALARHQSKSS